VQTDVGSRVKLCFSALRYYPIWLRDKLRQTGLWEDLEQELQLAAWEAEREKLGSHDTCLLASRRIWAFLKAYGYRETRSDGHKSYRNDKLFSSIAQNWELLERALARARSISEVAELRTVGVKWRELFEGQAPRRADFIRDHPQEAILALLRKTPEGISKRDLYTRLALTAHQLDQYCAPLIKQGLIIEVKRLNRSRPLTPLLLAVGSGQQLPLSPVVDRDDRIRHAYLVEGKGIKRIARGFHHSRETVRKALSTGGAQVTGQR